MIESFIADLVKDRILEELTPYIIVGFLSFLMFLGYQVTERVDTVIERRKK